LNCTDKRCQLEFLFESSVLPSINVMTFLGDPIDHNLVLTLGEPFQSSLKASESQKMRIYITSERMYTVTEYVVTLNQIYGLTSFKVLSHDEENIHASQQHSVVQEGQYVWASILIQEESGLDRRVDYIELEVSSQVLE
jgi:hypothetical protein